MYSGKEREKLKGLDFVNRKLVSGPRYFLKKKKGKKKERMKKKGERRKGLLRETFMFDTAWRLNIADSLKEKEKRKRNCFLNLIIICLIVAH